MAENSTEKGVQFLDELKESTKGRLSNPVLFSYLFSWIVCNWGFISFMFFSNKTIEKKLNTYGKYINYCDWLYPFIGVFIYLVILNYVDILFLWVSRRGYNWKVKSLEDRQRTKMKSDLEVTKEKIILQSTQVEADKYEVVLQERDRLSKELEKTEAENNSLNERLKKQDIEALDRIFDENNKKALNQSSALDVIAILERLGLSHRFMFYADENSSPRIYIDNTEVKEENMKIFYTLDLFSRSTVANYQHLFPVLTRLGNETLNILRSMYPKEQ